jgi:NAD(P)-dependent dehydrogenase (short-subunit alcohol dehydrogenase family)
LVTGRTEGIGAAVVEILRSAGLAVVAVARSVPPSAPDAAVYVAAAG